MKTIAIYYFIFCLGMGWIAVFRDDYDMVFLAFFSIIALVLGFLAGIDFED